jgi:membrane protein YqaA with SNARE-associated domain
MTDLEFLFDLSQSISQSSLFTDYGLYGLLVNSVLSPIIPFPPEVTASALILTGESMVIVATILSVGWIISCVIGYYIGFYGNNFIKRRFALKSGIQYNHKDKEDNNTEGKNKHRAYILLNRYGWAILFISPWIPIIGDIITIVAGIKRYPFRKYIISIGIGKVVRAIVIVYLHSLIMPLIINWSW